LLSGKDLCFVLEALVTVTNESVLNQEKENSCLANGVALLSCSNYHFHLENIAFRNAGFNQLLQHILLVQPKTPRKMTLRKELGSVNRFVRINEGTQEMHIEFSQGNCLESSHVED
jgi:hemerythrin